MQETAQIDRKNIDSGQITDLNIVIANMKMSGKRNVDIAREMGISNSAVCQHLKRFKDLVSIDGEIDTNAINNSRVRLINRLEKAEKVIDYALKPKTYKKSPTFLGIAANTSVSMFKGLHVFTEKTENVTKIDVFTQQREDQQARIQAAKQFGLDPGKELPAIEAQTVENSVQTGCKQAQAVVPDDSPMNVPRADKSGQPDISPIISNNND